MKLGISVSMLGSALALYNRQEGSVLRARQVGQPGNETEALRAALAPMVYVEEPACSNVIAMIGADPATAQCCSYLQQFGQQNMVPGTAAASAWLDGYCASSCRFQYSIAAGQIAAGCNFKPHNNASSAELAVVFRSTVDIMGAISCTKDSAGNYCILTVGQTFQESPINMDQNNPNDQESERQVISRLCSIPCGLQLLDAAQNYTGFSGAAICSMISSGPLPDLSSTAVQLTTAGPSGSTSLAAGETSPAETSSPPPLPTSGNPLADSTLTSPSSSSPAPPPPPSASSTVLAPPSLAPSSSSSSAANPTSAAPPPPGSAGKLARRLLGLLG